MGTVRTGVWQVVIYSNLPKQNDGSACGIFACVFTLHLFHDATLPDVQTEILSWRQFTAQVICAELKKAKAEKVAAEAEKVARAAK